MYDMNKIIDIEGLVADHISPNLRERLAREAEKNPVELWWDYRDKLSDEQVSKILEGKEWEVYDDMYSWNMDYISDLENEAAKEVLSNHTEELSAGLTIDPGELNLKDLVYELELYTDVPVDLNINDLVKNTDISLAYQLKHEMYQLDNASYSDFEEILEFLSVNPRSLYDRIYLQFIQDGNLPDEWEEYGWIWDYRDNWPDIPERDSHELVTVNDLFNMISYTHYGGYVSLAFYPSDLLQFGYQINRDDVETELVFPKGAKLMVHDDAMYGYDAHAPLTRELRIKVNPDNLLHIDTSKHYWQRNLFDSEPKVEVKEKI